MTYSAKTTLFSVAAALGVALAGATAVHAGSAEKSVLSPTWAIVMPVGGQKAVGYFTKKGDACDLTLHVAPAFQSEARMPLPPARIKMSVKSGTKAHVETEAGDSLALTCHTSATLMSIEPVTRVSYAAVAK